MRPSRLRIALVGVLGGCAPAVGSADDGSTGTESGDATTGAAASTSSTASSTSSTTSNGDGSTSEVGGYEDDGGGTGCAFTCPAPPGGGGVCNLLFPDCPAEQKCAAWANDGGNVPNATTCRPTVPVPDLVGEPCGVEGSMVSGIDTCQPGAHCWWPDGHPGLAECRAICGAFADQPLCPDGTWCGRIGILPLCLDACDPLDPEACGEAEACQPGTGGFVCIPRPHRFAGLRGEPCEFPWACEVGLTCVAATALSDCSFSGGCCADFCDLGLSDACPEAGDACVAVPELVPFGSEDDVGVCLY